MELPIVYAIKLKPGLRLDVVLYGDTAQDAAHLKQVASLLITVAKAVENWQAVRGSYGTPMPPVSLRELEEAQ